MKIGILTLPLHTNYGGILQAYALQTVLERMGNEVRVLDREYGGYKLHPLKAPMAYCKRVIKKYLLRKECIIFAEQKARREHSIVRQHTDRFINQYIKRVVYTDLSLLPTNSYDALVVGSDQIWRPKYYKQIEQAYFAFAKEWNVKRIAYAPSFGTDQWEYTSKQTATCKSMLEKFNLVTIREISGVELCKEHFDLDAIHVVDPTLLLDRIDYESLVYQADIPKSEGNLLVYILDLNNNLETEIEKLARAKGLKSFYRNSRVETLSALIEERIQPPVESWIRGFMDAKLIITDSFHACVFAIIFNKPFIALGNKRRGMSRFYSLLKYFNLEHLLVTEIDEIKKYPSINWDIVNQKISESRKIDIDLLRKVLAV